LKTPQILERTAAVKRDTHIAIAGDPALRDSRVLYAGAHPRRREGSDATSGRWRHDRFRARLGRRDTFLRGGAPPAHAEDGILTAEDVATLNLLGTSLVVLSACNSGLGEA